MVTELSRYYLGVAFFKTLISRSYLINFLITGGFLWLARTVCYSQLILAGQLCITRSVAHYSVSCVLFCQLWITISRLHDDTASCVLVLGQ